MKDRRAPTGSIGETIVVLLRWYFFGVVTVSFLLVIGILTII